MIEIERIPTITLLLLLQVTLKKYGDMEHTIASFENYEKKTRKELLEAKEKFGRDRAVLQKERLDLVKESALLEEKQNRIGNLGMQLDERDSKLMQVCSCTVNTS